MIIWSAGAPPQLLETQVNFAKSYVCGSNRTDYTHGILITVIVYNAIILATATWLALQTRKVVSAFRESTSIALSVYNTVAISIIAIPIIYLSGSSFNSEAIFIVKAVAILVVSGFGMFALFGPKLYILYIAKSKNILKDVLDQTSSRVIEVNKTEMANMKSDKIATALTIKIASELKDDPER